MRFRGLALQVVVELRRRRARAFEEHHPLTERLVIALGNHRVLPALGEPRTEYQRIGHQAADGISRCRELRGLRDRVSEHQLRANRVPQATLPQHRLRGLAVWRNVRVRDRESSGLAALDHASEPVEPFINGERRSVGREDHQPANCVHDAGIASQTSLGQLIGELLIGGKEQLERRTVLDLSRQRPRRTEHDFD